MGVVGVVVVVVVSCWRWYFHRLYVGGADLGVWVRWVSSEEQHSADSGRLTGPGVSMGGEVTHVMAARMCVWRTAG